jgi:hypothetical protein
LPFFLSEFTLFCLPLQVLTKSALIDGHGNNHNSPAMHANSGGVNATVSTGSGAV